MSVEQVKAFLDKLKEDAALANKIKDAEMSCKDNTSLGKTEFFAKIFIPIAAEAGFNFTAEDLKAAFDDSEGEVSEDELNAVAGGGCDDFAKNCTPGSDFQALHDCGAIQFGVHYACGVSGPGTAF